jgi:hypothetical protein
MCRGTDPRQSFAEVKVGSAGKMTRGHERELDGRDGEEVAAWVCGRCPELSLKYRGGKNLNEFTHRHQLRVTLKSQITRSAPIFCTNARTDPLGRGRERLLDVNPAEARRIIPLQFVIGSEAGAAGLTPRLRRGFRHRFCVCAPATSGSDRRVAVCTPQPVQGRSQQSPRRPSYEWR